MIRNRLSRIQSATRRHGRATRFPQNRSLTLEGLEDRRLLAGDWHNAVFPADVNGDGVVSPLDPLLIINEINAGNTGDLPALGTGEQPIAFYDTTNDGVLSPLDALFAVNALNDLGSIDISLTDVTALSNHYFRVTFSQPVPNSLLTPDAYALTGPDSSTLSIHEVFAGDTPDTVILLTDSQEPVEYSLHADAAPRAPLSAAVTVTGSEVREPFLETAIALSSTSVLLTFSEEMHVDTIENESFYRIVAQNGESPSRDIGHITIDSAVRGEDGRTVILTTSSMENIEYDVKVTNVLKQNRNNSEFIDPYRNTSSFFGILHSDGLELVSAVPTNPTTILLSFSERIAENSIDLSDFTATYVPSDADPLPEAETLVITDYELSPTGTEITLTTFPQPAGVDVKVVVNSLLDIAGNGITVENEPPSNIASFETAVTQAPPTESLPRLTGVAAIDNTHVIVAFSRSMGDSALVAQNYIIGQANENPEAGTLLVTGAEYLSSDNHATIKLTTMSQNELTYALTAVNVRDVTGQPMAAAVTSNGVLVDPTTKSFPGVPFVGPQPLDSDGDGLSDSAEQRGWTVSFQLADGSFVTRGVTSDPNEADTDGDGFSDSEEAALRLDPRDRDTDDDLLEDEYEFNTVFSSPSDQDTDDDGLGDDSEFHFFGTSPLLADTDGDQFTDDEEVITDNRNPRIADLPRILIDTGNVDLRLDVRFEEQTSEGTTVLESKSVETTLANAEDESRSKETSSTSEWFLQGALTGCYGGACDSGGETLNNWGVALEVTGGYSSSTTATIGSESTRSSQREYASSLSTDEEVSAESVVTRMLEGATMAVEVSIKNEGNIAFSVSNIEITALIRDPRDPTVLSPVATLFAASDEPISIGPLTPVRGPFRFVADEAYPNLVESLMANPRAIEFRVANYDIVDEAGRNYSFVEQDVNDRTAFLEIDFGGNLPLEKYQVATNGSYDDDGNPSGVTLREVMEDILGLEYVPQNVDEGLDPTNRADADLLDRSYSTRMIATNAAATESVEALYRVKGVSPELVPGAEEREWWVLTPQGLIVPIFDADGRLVTPADDFRDFSVLSDQAVAFKFVQDLDGDGLEATEEAALRSIDSATDTEEDDDSPDSRDTDNDGVDDPDEVYGFFVGNKRIGWTVQPVGQDAFQTYAAPNRVDTDFDGLTDAQELLSQDTQGLLSGDHYSNAIISVYVDDEGVPTLHEIGDPMWQFTLPHTLDPASPDTDGDGLTDAEEIAGFRYRSLLGDDTIINPGSDPDTVFATDPLNRDTDGDGLDDFQELRLGTSPVFPDGDDVLDDDGDGLVNAQETRGFEVDSHGRAPAIIMDDGDNGFVVDSGNSEESGTGFLDDSTTLTDGIIILPIGGNVVVPAGKASWSFENLQDGPYRVAATWPNAPDLSDEARYAVIIPGTDEHVGLKVNQRQAPDDFQDADADWEDLGYYYVVGGQIIVELQTEFGGFSGSEPVVADAIRIEPIVTSIKDPDSDDDGLTDWEELMGCRDRDDDLACDTEVRFGPTDPTSQDTDGDGLTDRQEVDSVDFPADSATPFRFTDPRKPDTDGDGRSDYDEVMTSWRVQVVGQGAYDVFSDPVQADSDGDGLKDGKEESLGSHPNNPDTDDDGALDGLEASRATNILEQDYLVTVYYRTLQVIKAGDTDGNGEFYYEFLVGVPQPDGVLDLIEAASLGNGLIELDQYESHNISNAHAISFPVAFTDLFTIEGRVQEKDGSIVDMNFDFGGIGSADGMFSGSALTIGSTGVAFENSPIDEDDAVVKVTVQIKVE